MNQPSPARKSRPPITEDKVRQIVQEMINADKKEAALQELRQKLSGDPAPAPGLGGPRPDPYGLSGLKNAKDLVDDWSTIFFLVEHIQKHILDGKKIIAIKEVRAFLGYFSGVFSDQTSIPDELRDVLMGTQTLRTLSNIRQNIISQP